MSAYSGIGVLLSTEATFFSVSGTSFGVGRPSCAEGGDRE